MGCAASAFANQSSPTPWNFCWVALSPGSIHPASQDPVAPNALGGKGIGHILGEGCQRPFRRRIRRQVRLAAMGDHRKDVDDAAWMAGFDQVSDHPLHQQEWAARIGIELTVPELEAGVQQRAAVCEALVIAIRLLEPPAGCEFRGSLFAARTNSYDI